MIFETNCCHAFRKNSDLPPTQSTMASKTNQLGLESEVNSNNSGNEYPSAESGMQPSHNKI